MTRCVMVRVAAILLVVAAAVLAAAWIALRLRRVPKRRRRRERSSLPVVLAHGMFGFDSLQVRGRKVEYFRGVSRALKRDGVEVHVPRLSTAGSVKSRSLELAAFVRSLDVPKVHLIAHSMGGLDARRAISKGGLAPSVASLVTVGAPHRGTPLAGAGAKILPARAARALRLDGVADLVPSVTARFNRNVRNVRGVDYCCVVGAPRGIVPTHLHPLLVPGFLWMRETIGANDGVVPSESQEWGEILAELDADHWAQVGWSTKSKRRFDAPGFYVDLVRELRSRNA